MSIFKRKMKVIFKLWLGSMSPPKGSLILLMHCPVHENLTFHTSELGLDLLKLLFWKVKRSVFLCQVFASKISIGLLYVQEMTTGCP